MLRAERIIHYKGSMLDPSATAQVEREHAALDGAMTAVAACFQSQPSFGSAMLGRRNDRPQERARKIIHRGDGHAAVEDRRRTPARKAAGAGEMANAEADDYRDNGARVASGAPEEILLARSRSGFLRCSRVWTARCPHRDRGATLKEQALDRGPLAPAATPQNGELNPSSAAQEGAGRSKLHHMTHQRVRGAQFSEADVESAIGCQILGLRRSLGVPR